MRIKDPQFIETDTGRPEASMDLWFWLSQINCYPDRLADPKSRLYLFRTQRLEGSMVSIKWYLGCLNGYLGGVGS